MHIVASLDEFGGTARKLAAEAAELADRIETHFVCLVRLGGGQRQLPPNSTCLLMRRWKYDPRIVLDLARHMRQRKIQVACTHFMRAGIWGRIAAKLADIPVLMFEHGLTRNERFPYLAIDRLLAHLTDLVVANSNATAQYIERRIGVPSDRIRVIYPYVFFQARPRPVRTEDSPRKIGNVAGLNQCKGHKTLLEAVGLLRREGRDVTVEIVGDGPLKGELQQLAGELGISDRVVFWGYRRDIDSFLAGIDVFAFPSESEGFGIALVEAMLAGVPVVCSDADALPEIVSHGHTGIVVPKGNAQALAEALKAIFDSPDRANVLASNALSEARRRFQERPGRPVLRVLAEAARR